MYQIVYSKYAQKDAIKLKTSGLDQKAKELILIIRSNPFQNPPPYEALRGNLKGAYSRRINIKHRLVYSVYKKAQTIKVHRMWSHYE